MLFMLDVWRTETAKVLPHVPTKKCPRRWPTVHTTILINPASGRPNAARWLRLLLLCVCDILVSPAESGQGRSKTCARYGWCPILTYSELILNFERGYCKEYTNTRSLRQTRYRVKLRAREDRILLTE